MRHTLRLTICLVVITAVAPWCPRYWEETSQNFCMMFVPHMEVEWEQGEEACEAQGGHLASIRNDRHKEWLLREVRKRNSEEGWWVGLNKHVNDGQWTWTDKSPYTDRSKLPWLPGHPTGDEDKECARIVSRPRVGLEDMECEEERQFICIRDKGQKIPCTYGWHHIEGSCYKVYDDERTWEEARQQCVRRGGDLADPHEEHLQKITSALVTAHDTEAWIGLRADNAGRFTWTTGEPFSFTAWAENPPRMMRPKSQTCVKVIPGDAPDESWATRRCTEDLNYVCKKDEGECPPGWRIHHDFCYEFQVQLKLTWIDAKRFCEERGANITMLTVRSKDENIFFQRHMKELRNAGITLIWLGLSDRHPGREIRWVTGEKVSDSSYKPWARGQPNQTPQRDNCGVIPTDSDAKWELRDNCLQQHGFICKTIVGTEVEPHTTIPPNFRCPADWETRNQDCYHVLSEEATWQESKQACRNLQPHADLVTIMDEEEQNWINEELEFGEEAWIGLNRIGSGDAARFIWNGASTTPVLYTNWDERYPQSTANLNCGIMIDNEDHKGRWRNIQCDEDKQAVCKTTGVFAPATTPAPGTPTSSWTQKCGPSWDDDPTSPYCYRINSQFIDWNDARRACQDDGGDLVSIVSRHEQSFIMGRILGRPGMQLWIGMNDRSRPNIWRWANGDPGVYFNWKAGSPNRDQSSGDCGVIIMSTGRWTNAPCGDDFGSVCKKMGNVTTPTPGATTTVEVPPGSRLGCKSGWRTFQGKCYRVVQQKMVSWQDSQKNCRMMGGDLVTIDNQAQQNFLKAYADAVVTKPVWRYHSLWIGLNERRHKGVYEWSDGSPVVYTNWDDYEPNNHAGRNEDCVNMYIKTSGWNDKECEAYGNSKGYVCQAAMSILQGTGTLAPPNCKAGFEYSYGAYCYAFVRQLDNWDEASDICERMEGELVDIHDSTEQAFLASILATERGRHWIGLSNRGRPDGSYRWITDEPLKYTNWYRDYTGNERNKCVAINSGQPVGLWEPRDCDEDLQFICKHQKPGVSPPASTPTPSPLPPCTQGWRMFDQWCYKAWKPQNNTQKLSWARAQDFCETVGNGHGDLASIHSKAENDRVGMLFPTGWYVDPNFWIGLNHRNEEEGEHWVDETPVDYHNWAARQPDRNNKKANCVKFNMRTDTWAYSHCDAVKSWVCKVHRSTTIVDVTIPPPPNKSPTCGNNPDWLHWGGNCYYFSSTKWDASFRKDWYHAREYCRGMGAELVSIHSEAEQAFLTVMTSRSSNIKKVWIGLNELERLGQYKWSDGTTAEYLNWNVGEPSDNHYGERCVDMYVESGFWNDDNCGTRLGFICKKRNDTTVPPLPPSTVVPGYCPKGYYGIGNKCFGVFGYEDKDKKNWTGALSACLSKPGRGSHLASILSPQANALITAHFTTKNIGFWIGYNSVVNQHKWEWVDNAPVRYTNWGADKPKDADNARCTEIWSRKGYEGLWSNIACSSLRGYVCEQYKDGNNIINTPPTLPPIGQSCPAGYSPYWYACYKLSTDRQPWQQARTACGREQAFLASVHSEAENSFLYYMSTMSAWESVWLGMNDVQTPGQYQWTDGWPVLYTRWGKDQPQGTGCVSLNPRGRWNTTDCGRNLFYVCKQTTVTPPTPEPTNTPGRCPTGEWLPKGKYCYIIKAEEAMKWSDAEFRCVQSGGHLASIEDATENDWILREAQAQGSASQRPLWIGMLKRGSGGGFFWTDGKPIGYQNWAPGEPNNKGAENCVEMYYTTGKWNDLACGNSRGYVCKANKILLTTRAPPVPSVTEPAESTTRKPGSTTTSKIPISPKTTRGPRPPPNTGARRGGPGLSAGGKVGVAFAVIAIVLIAIIVVLMVLRRRNSPIYERFGLRAPSAVNNPSYEAAPPRQMEPSSSTA